MNCGVCLASFFCYFHFNIHIWIFQKVRKAYHLWYLAYTVRVKGWVVHFLCWVEAFCRVLCICIKLQPTKSFIYEEFIGFILSTYKKNISLHQKNSTYAHQPCQNGLSKLKVWIVDLACPSIYEQFVMPLLIG